MDNIDQNMSDIDFLPDEPPFFSIQVNSSKRFFHPPEDDDSGSMQVVAGGCEHCIQGYSVDRSDFPFYAFEFLASGAGTLILDGKHFQLTPGTCFFYGPGITHTITNIGAGMLVKYFADFSPSGAYPVLMENLGLQNKVVHVPIPGSIVHTIEDLIDTGRKRSHFSRQICSRLAELVIYKIADCAYESKDIYTSSYKSYRRCKGIIEKHFLDIWTLKDISELSNLNGAYICRLFKRYDHQTPYQYLQQLKMNHAAEHLLTNTMSIKELGYSMGYEDQFHFTRSFKQVIGFSPSKFIEMNRIR